MGSFAAVSPQEENVTLQSVLAHAEHAGYPSPALADLRSRAEMLQRVAELAKIDVDAEARYVWERLPEARLQRAAEEKKSAQRASSPAERLSMMQHAQRLEAQAKKLGDPSVDEKFRARAVATELSIRLNAKIREIQISVPDIEPSSLRLFEKAFADHTRGVELLGKPRGEAEHAARLAFLQAMVESDATPDDPAGLRSAIVQYRRNTTRDFGAEPGYLKDQPLDVTPEVEDIPDETAEQEDPENAASHARSVSRLSRALSLAAAASLNDRQYAIYRVLADNTHLFDWKIEQDKLLFVKRSGVERGENIAAKVMEEVGGYSGRGAAYRAVHETIDNLGSALQKMGRNVTIDDLTAKQRVQVIDRLSASHAQVLEAAQKSPRTRTKKRQSEEIE